MTFLLIAVGAAVGAPARYLTDRALRARYGDGFPWGTLVVNVAGSFLLGVIVAAATHEALDERVLAGLGTGFCGALTTYSTFSHETLRLLEDGSQARAAANVAVSIIAGTVAATVGWSIGAMLTYGVYSMCRVGA